MTGPTCPGCPAEWGHIEQYTTLGVEDDIVRLCYCRKCHSFFKADIDWNILSGTLDEIERDRAQGPGK